jgi:hypothetical protein
VTFCLRSGQQKRFVFCFTSGQKSDFLRQQKKKFVFYLRLVKVTFLPLSLPPSFAVFCGHFGTRPDGFIELILASVPWVGGGVRGSDAVRPGVGGQGVLRQVGSVP